MIIISNNEQTQYLDYTVGLNHLLSDLENKVRSKPQDSELRWGLFQTLCIMEDWPRALKQLQTYATLSKSAPAMAHTLKELIICEQHRTAYFKGDTSPAFFFQKEWHQTLLLANQQACKGNLSESDQHRLAALEMAPTVSGTINQQAFKLLFDADTRLGPTLEFYTNGMYHWISLDDIKEINISGPKTTIDLIWQAAECTLKNGDKHHGFIPVRYISSANVSDDHRLSKLSSWDTISDTLTIGQGQKTWVTDQYDMPTLEVRHLITN